MGFRINTNVPSISAQNNLRASKLDLDKSLQKLSSGQRINRAGDDAAGLAISEQLRAQIRGLEQTKRNTQDGISLVQIAEGSLNEVSSILIRLRELAIQSASDTVGATERKFLNFEFSALKSEIDRIIRSTEFNGVKLLKDGGVVLDIQVGTRNDPLSDRLTFDSLGTGVDIRGLGLVKTDILEKLPAQKSLDIIDQAITTVSGVRAKFGALQNRLQSVLTNIHVSIENLSGANSRIRDADIAKQTSELTRSNILVKAGLSVLAQANRSASSVLGLINATAQV